MSAKNANENIDATMPVVIVQGAQCLGCGKKNCICLEIGVKGGHLTLACKKCVIDIYTRVEKAIE